MEFVIILFLVVIALLINNMKSSVLDRIRSLEVGITALRKQVHELRPSDIEGTQTGEPKAAAGSARLPMSQLAPPVISEEIIHKEQAISREQETVVTPLEETPKVDESVTEEPSRPGFFERNPDLEKFVGENLANKIGIGILVLGIGFFVKYAIDQNWINEIGRVSIGLVAGGILLGIAHRMRNMFAGFSSVLIGGGIAILYLTIAIAFHEYQLLSQGAAFGIMIGITSFAILFSIGYDRIELAVVAILGGFGSPFMVSTGEGNYIVLLTYILVLDIGMLVLAYYKKWNLVNIICYVFTGLLFGTWLKTRFDLENTYMVKNAMLFATSFFIVFFVMHVINNIKSRRQFVALDYSLLLSNSFLYYAAGMVILKGGPWHDLRGLFTAAIGIFNFAFAFALYKRDGIDRNLIYLLIGLVLTFISLAAPIQLDGNHITLFWAAEAVVLLWLYQKSEIKLIGLASIIVTALMTISLMMDWQQIYGWHAVDVMSIILNKGFSTGIVSFVSLMLTLRLLKNEATTVAWLTSYRMILSTAASFILYATLLLELRYQLPFIVDAEQARTILVGVYNMVFILGLFLAEKRLLVPDFLKNGFAVLGLVGMVSYGLFYHQSIVAARNYFLWGEATATGIASHYALLAAVLTVSILTLNKVRSMEEFNTNTFNAYAWLFILFYVFISSAELDHLVVLVGYSGPDSLNYLITQNHKIGYPILWGLTSFGIIAFGLSKKKRHLRLISLCLLLITLLKLFLVDIRGISEGGKIAAFISLGALLLIISFMYQRLKRILLTDDAEKEKTT